MVSVPSMLLTYWTETQYMIYREVSWLRLLLRRKLEGIYPQKCSIACNASATESAFQGQKNIQLDNDSITRAFNCLSFVEGFIRCIPISPCLVIITFTYFYLGWHTEKERTKIAALLLRNSFSGYLGQNFRPVAGHCGSWGYVHWILYRILSK